MPVATADGAIGEVGDLVIDPITENITHIVVQPHHRHYQARLVSIDVVAVDDQAASIGLSTEQVRALPTVADSDFVRFEEQLDLGEDWDAGIEHVVSMPYAAGSPGLDGSADAYSLSDGVTVDFDRIPKGECEIRRASEVLSSDGHAVGLVDGFLADDLHIEGVIVQTGLPGFRHLVVIPIGHVTRVESDHITTSLTKRMFRELRPVGDLEGVHASNSRLERLEHATAAAGHRLRQRAVGAIRRGTAKDDADDSATR